VLEELEVEFAGSTEKKWGVSVWYKDHPNYHTPINPMFQGTALNDPSLFHATFKTEYAGDQKFCLYSTQMMASVNTLVHKTLIYRKVVFSRPQPKAVKRS
jgi:hypothetical protein